MDRIGMAEEMNVVVSFAWVRNAYAERWACAVGMGMGNGKPGVKEKGWRGQ